MNSTIFQQSIKAIALSLILSSCGTPDVRQVSLNTYQVKARVITQGSFETSQKEAYQLANKQCQDMNKGMDPIEGKFSNDGITIVYLLSFQCYDLAERAEQNRKKQEAAKKEQERKAAIEAEE